MGLVYDSKYKKLVKKVKLEFNPPMPKSLVDVGELLQTEMGQRMLQYEDGSADSITSHIVKNTNKNGTTSNSLILMDPTFIQRVLDKVEPGTLEGFCDATFRPVPKSVHGRQLLVFQVNRFNHAQVLFYAIMERKTTEAYEAIFRYIDVLVPELKQALGKVHMDFELAESNAIKTLMPHVKIVTCLFHFAQAQWKQAEKKHALMKPTRHGKEITLTEEQQNISRDVDELIRLFCKMPFLKPEDINEQLVDHLVSSMCPGAQKKVVGYIHYFKYQWLNRRKPEEWSITGEAHRTNNFSESNNRDMNLIIDKNPLPWNFVRSIVEMQRTILRVFDSRTTPKLYNRDLELNIQKLMVDYQLKQITRVDLLMNLMRISRSKDDQVVAQILDDAAETGEEITDEEGDTAGNTEGMTEEAVVENAGDSFGQDAAAISDLRRFFSSFRPDM